MKVGSLVKLLCNRGFDAKKRGDIEHGWNNTYPEVGKIYTVRAVNNYMIRGRAVSDIWLEEIVNPKYQYRDGFNERAWASGRFREVVPAEAVNIAELLREPVSIAA